MKKNYTIAPVRISNPMDSAKVMDIHEHSRITMKGKKYAIGPSRDYIEHSAKGSSWEKHDYIKVIDGKYYYPDSYEGGRHLPKDRRQLQQEAIKETAGEPAGWESKFYGEWEKNLKGTGGKLDPKALQNMLMFGKDENGKGYDNFAVALAKMAGIDAGKIKPEVLNRMRLRAIEHYEQQFEKEKDNFDKEGNRIKDRTADQQKAIDKGSKSKKTSSSKSKKSTTDDGKTKKSSKKSSSKKKGSSSSSKTASSASKNEPTSTDVINRAKANKEAGRLAIEKARKRSSMNKTGSRYITKR